MTESDPVDPATRAMRHILAINDDSFDKLIDCLSQDPLPSREADLEKRIQKAAPALSTEIASSVVGFSTAFAGALFQMTDQPKFLGSIIRRAKEKLGDEYDEKLKERLSSLFSSPAVAFIGGGKAAQRDNVHMVLRSLINTDLRPIPLPSGASAKHFTMLHRIKFDYVDDLGSDSERSIELVLDNDDLQELGDRIAVAIATQASLQETVAKLGGSVFLPQEERDVDDE